MGLVSTGLLLANGANITAQSVAELLENIFLFNM